MFVALAPGAAQADHTRCCPARRQNVMIAPEPASGIRGANDFGVGTPRRPTGGEPPTGYRIDRSEDNGTFMEFTS